MHDHQPSEEGRLAAGVALGAALFAARLARRPAGGMWTFGLARAGILSAAANGATRVVLAVGVIIIATGWVRADAVASLVLVAVLVVTGTKLLHAFGRILLGAHA